MTDTLERPEVEAAPRKPKRRMRRLRSAVLIMVFVIGGFVVTGVLPVREYLERGTDVDTAQIELDRLTAENAALSDDIEAMYTEEELERLAREQYGFVREGEIGYVVIPDGTESTTAPQTGQAPVDQVPTSEQDRSFFERIWDFVTGNDQTSNG